MNEAHSFKTAFLMRTCFLNVCHKNVSVCVCMCIWVGGWLGESGAEAEIRSLL